MRHLPILFAAQLLLIPPAAAQDERVPAAAADRLAGAMRVPVHSGAAGHGSGYGTWAAGTGFKASFHDGFAFYPELGPSYPDNLPLRWQTAAVTMGGVALPLLPSPELSTGDWHAELRHPGWRERYDVRADGVEQTFVIEERPAGKGDFVVRARITTNLRAEPVRAAWQKLVFTDAAGNPLVEYGHAFAIDAAGRRTAVTTSFDGQEIALTVDGGWLGDAVFPVTVDPLTSPVLLHQLTTAPIDATDVCSEQTGTQARNTMTAFTRVFSANDHDVIAILSQADFQNAVPVFSDVNYTSNPRNVSVAFVAGTANRWLIACQGQNTSSLTTQLYFHDLGNTGFNSGLVIHLPGCQACDVGGAAGASGVHGLLVYWLPNNNAMAWAIPIDAAARQAGTPYALGPNPNSYARNAPKVNQTAIDNAGWLVAWQENNFGLPGTPTYVQGARIGPTGTLLATAPLMMSPTDNLTQVNVAGAKSQDYMVTWSRPINLGSSLQAARVGWDLAQPGPTVAPAVTFASGIVPVTVSNGSLAYDHVTGGFFAATWTSRSFISGTTTTTARIARLSRNGYVIEAAVLFSTNGVQAVVPSVTYAATEQTFPAVYSTDESSHPLRGRALAYPTAAVSTPYGTGCGTAAIASGRPLAGNQNFRVSLAGAPPNAVGLLFTGFAQRTAPLDYLGLTGCISLLDPAAGLYLLVGVANATGDCEIPVPLPDHPALTGDLYFQYAYGAAGANPAGLLVTRGLLAQVR